MNSFRLFSDARVVHRGQGRLGVLLCMSCCVLSLDSLSNRRITCPQTKDLTADLGKGSGARFRHTSGSHPSTCRSTLQSVPCDLVSP
eukprot:scaffold245063_cov23-Tisochrysis_lutea.AAC.3